jgi:hypothetical protein
MQCTFVILGTGFVPEGLPRACAAAVCFNQRTNKEGMNKGKVPINQPAHFSAGDGKRWF